MAKNKAVKQQRVTDTPEQIEPATYQLQQPQRGTAGGFPDDSRILASNQYSLSKSDLRLLLLNFWFCLAEVISLPGENQLPLAVVFGCLLIATVWFELRASARHVVRVFAAFLLSFLLGLVIGGSRLPNSRVITAIQQAQREQHRIRSKSWMASPLVKSRVRVRLRGVVVTEPVVTTAGLLRFQISTKSFGGGDAILELSVAPLPWDGMERLRIGAEVAGEARVLPVVGIGESAPPLLSYQGSVFRGGVVGYGLLSELVLVENPFSNEAPADEEVEHSTLESLVSKYGERTSLAVLLAAILGRDEYLGQFLVDIFRRTGTTHLVVVSGFHVGVIFILLLKLSSALWRIKPRAVLFCPAQRVSVGVAICGVVAYLSITGWSIPSTRAFFALLVFAIGNAVDRKASRIRPLLLASLLVNIWSPFAFLEPSFQLTFSALLGLQYADFLMRRVHELDQASYALRDLIYRGQPPLLIRLRKAGMSLVLGCICAYLFTAPVVLFWFKAIAPVAILVNVMVIHYFTAICLVVGGIGLVLHLIGFGSFVWEFALTATDWMIEFLDAVARYSDGTWVGYQQFDPERVTTPILCHCVGLALIFSVVWLLSRRRSYILPDE